MNRHLGIWIGLQILALICVAIDANTARLIGSFFIFIPSVELMMAEPMRFPPSSSVFYGISIIAALPLAAFLAMETSPADKFSTVRLGSGNSTTKILTVAYLGWIPIVITLCSLVWFAPLRHVASSSWGGKLFTAATQSEAGQFLIGPIAVLALVSSIDYAIMYLALPFSMLKRLRAGK